MDHKRQNDHYPSFKQLVEFIIKEAVDADDPIYGQSKVGTLPQPQSDSKPKKTSFGSTTAPSKEERRPASPCILCKQYHRLFYCDSFKRLKPVERLALVKKYKLCENCLLSNHAVATCRKVSVCSVPGCGQKHTRFIHVDVANENIYSQGSQSVHEQGPLQTSNAAVSQVVNESTSLDSDVYVPVVEVRVNNKVGALALLDTASTASFCTRGLLQSLGIQGVKTDYVLSTLSQSNEKKFSEVVNLSLMSSDGRDCLILSNVFVLDEIPVKQYDVKLDSMSPLNSLSFVRSVSKVDLLIGQDHAEALIPLQVQSGKPGEAFAVRTLFGWSINGPCTSDKEVGKQIISHFISTNTIDENVENLWRLDNEGYSSDELSMSVDDNKVMSLWNKSVRFVDGHYMLPIPFKADVLVPNNLEVAKHRLFALKRSLERKQMFDRYDAEIKKLFQRGHAENVVKSDIDGADKIWYLPHHAVVSDKKPGKVRVVFDCAAKYMGESLNDKCFQGPDFNNKLLHVLLRFRQHNCAIMADVEAMYYQVRVDPDDRDVLRFLWFDDAGNITCHRMTSHVFGGVWCSCAATYALRLAADDFGYDDPSVLNSVKNDFYVDDYLKSVDNVNDAKDLIANVKSVLFQGGFRLTKFVTNDDKMLQYIPEVDRASEVKDIKSDLKNKVLGIRWNVESDSFHFDTKFKETDYVTRRYILSMVSSTFDPLGLVSPVLVTGKLLFQDATRLKLKWDDVVPSDLRTQWDKWQLTVSSLQNLSIVRCVKPEDFNDSHVELHLFSDASEKAYGCCCYVRCINKRGQIYVSLLCSRNKLAPIKMVTIPRLELQAAVMAAKMNDMLVKRLTLDVAASYFWVDSDIVLKYIANNTKRYHTFVANRLSVIHSLTSNSQWNFICGKDNPADLLTRGLDADSLQRSSWFHGPQFLNTYKSEWNLPECDLALSSLDPEVKVEKSTMSCMSITVAKHPLDKLFDYFSSWFSLKKAVAWLLRLKGMLRKVVDKDKSHDVLTCAEVQIAEVVILQHVQSQCYSDDILKIKSGTPVSKSSPLRSLQPVLDVNGILCVGGRLKHVDVQYCNKHPAIVPNDHPITSMIARDSHNIAHLGTEWVLSTIRSKYWIVGARSVIKRIHRNCIC